MPLSMPGDELARLSSDELARLSSDAASAVAEKADEYICKLYGELDNVRAKADSASITAEQTCRLLEQKYLSLSQDFSLLESQNAKLQSGFDDRLAELAQSQAQKHQLHLQSLEKDGEIERMTMEMSEMQKSKRQLMELLEHKDAEISELLDVEKNYNESSSSLNWHKERLRELETKITSLQEELTSCKDAAAASEEQYNAEIFTANKLVELYKESSEEWSRKAGELQKEVSTNQKLEKEMEDIKQKLKKCEAEIEKSRKPDELRRVPFSSFTRRANDSGTSNTLKESQELISQVPPRVSGTTLAASLLRNGWSVLSEVEEKAGFIQEERGEYDLVNKKLEDSESEETNMDKSIMELKADLKRREHEKIAYRKEIYDLRKHNRTLKWMILMDEEGAAEIYNDYYDPGRSLAVSLLRNGWNVPKINEMYLAAVDASGLERREEAYPSILKRVLSELEEKVGFVQEERGEYSEDSESEEMNMDKSITELKADLRRLEHENIDSQNKISFLEDQVWLGLCYGAEVD